MISSSGSSSSSSSCGGDGNVNAKSVLTCTGHGTVDSRILENGSIILENNTRQWVKEAAFSWINHSIHSMKDLYRYTTTTTTNKNNIGTNWRYHSLLQPVIHIM